MTNGLSDWGAWENMTHQVSNGKYASSSKIS
jgi:hypothetical protein